jgi:hypothetical protein
MVLAAGVWLGLDVETTATILNVGAIVGTLLVTYRLMLRTVGDRWWVSYFQLLLGCSVGFTGIFGMLWSEPLFCFVVVAALWQLVEVARADGEWTWAYVGAGLLTWVACCLRYAGVALVVTGCAATILANRRRSWPRRLLFGLMYGVGASGALAVVAARNLSLDVGPFGVRGRSSESLGGVLRAWRSAIAGWLIPDGRPRVLYLVAALLVVAFVSVGALARLVRDWRGGSRDIAVLCMWVVVYAGYLTVSELVTPLDPIDRRLTSPMLPVVAILGVVAGCEYTQRLSRVRPSRWWLRLGLVAAVCVLVAVGRWNLQIVTQSADRGVGYNSIESRHSELTAKAALLPVAARIASNSPETVYWNTGRQPVRRAPLNRLYRSTEQQRDQVPDFVAWIRSAGGSPVYLAWFTSTSGDYVEPTSLEQAGVTMIPVERVADGVLYRIKLNR